MSDIPAPVPAFAVLPTTSATPTVYVTQFTGHAIGELTMITFFGPSGVAPGAQPNMSPVFSAVLSETDMIELQRLIEQMLLAKKTLKAPTETAQ